MVWGDSQVVINWVKGNACLKSLELTHWLESIMLKKKEFSWISFDHAYREFNQDANDLSKLVLGDMDGLIHYSFVLDGAAIEAGSFVFF